MWFYYEFLWLLMRLKVFFPFVHYLHFLFVSSGYIVSLTENYSSFSFWHRISLEILKIFHISANILTSFYWLSICLKSIFMIFLMCRSVSFLCSTNSLLLYILWLWLYRLRKSFFTSHKLLSTNHNHILPCDSPFIVGQGINSNWRPRPALMLTSPLHVLQLVDHDPVTKHMY